MISPRLTNCKECANIPDLLRKIDCKLAELGNNLYNNVVFMLNRPIAVSEISELLVYKRILQHRFCDSHYAKDCNGVSTEDIASKVIRLTAGCVPFCNEPTVCEITTCAIKPCPNPTTTTTSTSSTTTTSTSSTTTTTSTIYPDCRVEGCFTTPTTTTTSSTSTSTSTSSTTTTTTTNPITTSTTTSQIPVTGNTYFTFWSDTSGSMDSTIAVTAQIASVTGVKSLVSPTLPAGSTTVQLAQGNQINKVTVTAVNGDSTSRAYLCLVPGMEAIHPAIPAGTFIATGANVITFNLVDINGWPVATTADIVQGPNGIITFNLTDAQKTADYQNPTNLRNLLQDFYATGGTEASGNTDRSTNGSDEFESRVYWCHSPLERQISMLSNKGLGDTIGAGGYFPNADNLVIMAFGDESGTGYNMDGNHAASGPAWSTRASQINSRIQDDILSVRTFVTNLENAKGSTNIYRAKFFHPEPPAIYTGSTIKPLVSPTGLLNAGSNGAAVIASPPGVPASAYGSTDNLVDFPSASPVRFAWSEDLDNNPVNPEQYWYDQIRNALINFGYGV
jgi:hypothetical protein